MKREEIPGTLPGPFSGKTKKRGTFQIGYLIRSVSVDGSQSIMAAVAPSLLLLTK